MTGCLNSTTPEELGGLAALSPDQLRFFISFLDGRSLTSFSLSSKPCARLVEPSHWSELCRTVIQPVQQLEAGGGTRGSDARPIIHRNFDWLYPAGVPRKTSARSFYHALDGQSQQTGRLFMIGGGADRANPGKGISSFADGLPSVGAPDAAESAAAWTVHALLPGVLSASGLCRDAYGRLCILGGGRHTWPWKDVDHEFALRGSLLLRLGRAIGIRRLPALRSLDRWSGGGGATPPHTTVLPGGHHARGRACPCHRFVDQNQRTTPSLWDVQPLTLIPTGGGEHIWRYAQVYDVVESCDPATEGSAWISLPPLLSPRCGHQAVAALTGEVYVAGGYGGGLL
jgi:hypothetical protein